MRTFLRMMVMMVGLMATTPVAWALEAVVQSDVGSGSAVAGSIGAVNARADALQGNVSAVNMLVNQQAQQIKELQSQVSQTLAIVQQLQGGGSVVNNLQNSVTSVQGNVQNILACNAQGKLWNGAQCKDVEANTKGQALSGTWCGGHLFPVNNTIYNCNGHDPQTSCPAEYSRAYFNIGTYYDGVNINAMNLWTCIKN